MNENRGKLTSLCLERKMSIGKAFFEMGIYKFTLLSWVDGMKVCWTSYECRRKIKKYSLTKIYSEV